MTKLPLYFEPLSDLLTQYIDRRVDYFTVQTHGGGYIEGPYVQALHEHDNYMLVEATSNEFLKPKLDNEGHQKMILMGWRFYPEKYLPNYAQFIDLSVANSPEIADLLLRTLHFVYGVDDTYSFEIGPKVEACFQDISGLELLNVSQK